jgi:hypothetical protein
MAARVTAGYLECLVTGTPSARVTAGYLEVLYATIAPGTIVRISGETTTAVDAGGGVLNAPLYLANSTPVVTSGPLGEAGVLATGRYRR